MEPSQNDNPSEQPLPPIAAIPGRPAETLPPPPPPRASGPAPRPGGPPPRPSTFNPLGEKPKHGARGCIWGCGITSIIFAILVIALVIAGVSGFDMDSAGTTKMWSSLSPEQDAIEEKVIIAGDGNNKIAVISVSGVIFSGDRVSAGNSASVPLINQINKALNDDSVKAVVLDMNSPGGEVTATDEIHHALQRLREEGGKPVITCMRTVAASGGYYLAAGTDHIIANRLTLTGSIGVIIGGYNYAGLFDKIGLESELYTGGEMKDVLNMARDRTQAEIDLIQGLVDETYHEFATIVSEGRGIEIDTIKEEIGARIFSGKQALELNLVDELGYIEDAFVAAEAKAGITDAAVVSYGYYPTLSDMLFGMQSETRPAMVNLLSEEQRLIKKGRLYFMLPTAY